jgi:hypothetical protein
LGYAFHNTYIATAISKPSLATIRSIFQDGNTPAQDDPSLAGASGYIANSIPEGSYYATNQTQSYTVDYSTSEIVFSTPPTGGDLISIYNTRLQGESIIYNDIHHGDGSTSSFSLNAPYSSIEHSLIMIDGVETSTGELQQDPEDSNLANIYFVPAPAEDAHIHIVLSNNTVRNTISKPYTQLEIVSDTSRKIILDETIRFDRSKDTVLITELNGSRLRPGNTAYYIGDGSTTVYDLQSSAGESEITSLTNANVQIWINAERIQTSAFTLSTPDGSTLPTVTFNTAPADNANISITYIGDADYTYDVSDNSITISPSVTVSDGDLLAVTSFSAHDMYNIKTKVFVGAEESAETTILASEFDSAGFDSEPFENQDSVTKVLSQFTIDSNQNNASKILVSINGKKLFAYKDYTLTNGLVEFARAIQVTNTSEIIVTWSNSTEFSFSSTFQIFHNMNGDTSYKRLAACESTSLASDLAITDTTIDVVDASKLEVPDPDNGKPGVIFIAGERITYYTISGNTLGQLMRGTEGTAAKSVYEARTIVTNAGEGTNIPNPDKTWYTLGTGTPSDGLGLQHSQTTQAKFLKEKVGLVVSRTLLPDSFNVYLLDGYVEDDYVE